MKTIKEMKLNVAETFYSIQGEGPTTGTPAVFLRLANCNLLCKSKDWICDTIEVWQKGKPTKFEDVLSIECLDKLKSGSHLVITGGEPLLQQKRIIEYILYLKENGVSPYVEIETNGTIMPNNDLKSLVNQFNCSPKLKNSGEQYNRRINHKALNSIAEHFNSNFKFVVLESKDLEEVFELIHSKDTNINHESVYLMPAGATQNELNSVRLEVLELCKKYILKFTDRMHIVAWNQKTGV